MKKTFMVTSGIIFLTIISYAFTTISDEPKYKNLKILPKDITHEQMDSVMHHFANSLNVKCNFCHVKTEDGKEWNFAADDNKHKLTARNMMKMTNKINDKYFDVTGGSKNLSTPLMVTCYTCHHGANEPATKAPHIERPQQQAQADSARVSSKQ